jgi:hypothetical protein
MDIPVDKDMISEHLSQCRRHVSEGEKHIARQREIVAELARDGRDTTLARELLGHFEETQALHVAHRDRLAYELSKFSD